MEPEGQLAASRTIKSLTGWWELAGVDTAVGEMPVDWLAPEAEAEVVDNAVPPTPNNAPGPITEPSSPALNWPSDIDTLKTMVASGAALPGNGFGTAFVVPSGPATCEVMVLSDLPDQDELAAAKLGSGVTGALLGRMLAAIGVDLVSCYWTALATTIPPTGEIPEHTLGSLADFARHQIGLVKPSAIILLGSAPCKALLDAELMQARQSLGNFNHDDRNMVVLTTFHPRTLIARPAMKAQAWKDLQMFAKRAEL